MFVAVKVKHPQLLIVDVGLPSTPIQRLLANRVRHNRVAMRSNEEL